MVESSGLSRCIGRTPDVEAQEAFIPPHCDVFGLVVKDTKDGILGDESRVNPGPLEFVSVPRVSNRAHKDAVWNNEVRLEPMACDRFHLYGAARNNPKGVVLVEGFGNGRNVTVECIVYAGAMKAVVALKTSVDKVRTVRNICKRAVKIEKDDALTQGHRGSAYLPQGHRIPNTARPAAATGHRANAHL